MHGLQSLGKHVEYPRPFTHHPHPDLCYPTHKCALPTYACHTYSHKTGLSGQKKSFPIPEKVPQTRHLPEIHRIIDRFVSQNDILRGHRSGQSRGLRFCIQRRVSPPQCIGSRRHRPSGGAGGGVEPCPHWHKINIPHANANPPRPARSKPNERCVSTLAQTPFPLAQSAPTRLAALAVLDG